MSGGAGDSGRHIRHHMPAAPTHRPRPMADARTRPAWNRSGTPGAEPLDAKMVPPAAKAKPTNVAEESIVGTAAKPNAVPWWLFDPNAALPIGFCRRHSPRPKGSSADRAIGFAATSALVGNLAKRRARHPDFSRRCAGAVTFIAKGCAPPEGGVASPARSINGPFSTP